ncbi:type II toxin-antitoxin system ParD family antitoxin [Pseudomonas citronellolis]|uniref:type II toxin-antitoxin system ParD family antitoxin n=1 Tax=Pseudomonas citronellolis TaxID=53408 RepID=UPI0023E37BFD|nr:type II toxin-antitoxin system ParD family antitoxin [Pseudomonas citronellolis]MDF3934893.1 type II toxin-antitoxin system ParD family antitoxin [Pseudomonas citronellolis]
MATRNVVLPDPMERHIEELLKAGRYQNRSEVIRAGLRLLFDQEAEQALRLEALKSATASGILQLEAGDFDELRTAEDVGKYLDELGRQASTDSKDG